MDKYTKSEFAVHLLGCFFVAALSFPASADSTNLKQELQSFSVKTGTTRVIYTPGSSGSTLTVMNPQSYPMLVQSSVFKEDKKTKASFIVTPPLFRLDGYHSNRLTILATGYTGPENRETLNWLCITGIPPEPDSAWAKSSSTINGNKKGATILTQLRISSCLKLFVRPSSLKGSSTEYANELQWKKKGSKINVINPTRFYMNLASVQIGSLMLNNPGYVSPMSNLNIETTSSAEGPVKFKLITDFGGVSKEFQSIIN